MIYSAESAASGADSSSTRASFPAFSAPFLSTSFSLSAFLSVIKDNPWKRFDNVVVVHCARCADDITLTEAFNEAVKRQNREVNFRFIAATTREPDPSKCGEITRRIPEAIAQGEFEKMGFTLTPQWVRAMICGNPGFVDGVKKALKDRGFTAPRGEKLGTYVAENFW